MRRVVVRHDHDGPGALDDIGARSTVHANHILAVSPGSNGCQNINAALLQHEKRKRDGHDEQAHERDGRSHETSKQHSHKQEN